MAFRSITATYQYEQSSIYPIRSCPVVPINEDAAHGSLELMHQRVSPARLASATPAMVEDWFQQLSKIPEFRDDFYPEALSKTHGWRMAARICCVNTAIRNPPRLSKPRATWLTRGLLGPQLCASQDRLDNTAAVSAYWVIGIALSLKLKCIVSPKRVLAAFARINNGSIGATTYGKRLLERFNVSWPPCPEFALVVDNEDEAEVTAPVADPLSGLPEAVPATGPTSSSSLSDTTAAAWTEEGGEEDVLSCYFLSCDIQAIIDGLLLEPPSPDPMED